MFNPFRRPADRKAVPATHIAESKAARPLLATHLPRSAQIFSQAPATNYASLCREGFARNPVAHRCVRLIAESAASVPLRVSDAAAARLIQRGLPGSSAVETFEAFYGYLQLGGNGFFETVLSGEQPIALIAHRPDTLKMGQDNKGRPRGWEIIGVADIRLIDAQSYRLKTLLRGLNNSDDMMMPVIPAGARIVALDTGLANLPIDEDFIGQDLEIAVTAGGRSGVAGQVNYRAAHLRPLSIVHLNSEAVGEETRLSWIPRNLNNAESLNPAAQVEITWPGGAITTSERAAQLPITSGSGTWVTLTPIDPIGGAGAPKTILV